jgi:hypothetical protein
MTHLTALVLAGLLGLAAGIWAPPARADEAPIAGIVKTVDVAARTLTVDASARGARRTVVIDVPDGARIVRFVRSTAGGATSFAEQTVALGDVKPGSTVSVSTRHAGEREVAEVVRVVHER